MKSLLIFMLLSGCGLSSLVGRYDGVVTSTVTCAGVTTVSSTNVFSTTWRVEYEGNQLVAHTGGRCSPVSLHPVIDGEFSLSVGNCLALSPVGSAYFSGDGLLINSTGQLIYNTFEWAPDKCTTSERALLVRQK